MNTWFVIALLAGVVSVVFGVMQRASIMAAPAGNQRMREIAQAIQEGANAYLARQYRTIAMVGVVVVILLAILFRLARRLLPEVPLARWASALAWPWRKIQQLRRPALPERLNPGGSAGE